MSESTDIEVMTAMASIVEKTCDAVLNNDKVLAMRLIATMAIDLDELESVVRLEKADLSTAYRDHKSRIGANTHFARESPEWAAMLEVTKAEYAAVQKAKAEVGILKRKLKAAIAQYRKHYPEEFPLA